MVLFLRGSVRHITRPPVDTEPFLSLFDAACLRRRNLLWSLVFVLAGAGEHERVRGAPEQSLLVR